MSGITKKVSELSDTMGNSCIFVFEGIDKVGKSTILERVKKDLQMRLYTCSTFHFPGKDLNCLGGDVYSIHHKTSYDRTPNPAAIQLMHIAAHIDMWTNYIIPEAENGKLILLDRFWWSTYSYGKANGVDENILSKMIEIEKMFFCDEWIKKVFLIKKLHFGDIKLNDNYDFLANQNQHNTLILYNDGSIDEISLKIVDYIEECMKNE